MKRKWMNWVFGPCLIITFWFGVRQLAAALAVEGAAVRSDVRNSTNDAESALTRHQAGARRGDQRGAGVAGPHSTALGAGGPAAQPKLVANYGKLPLSFEANQGQTDPQVKFLSHGTGYTLFLTGNEALLDLRRPVQKANGKR